MDNLYRLPFSIVRLSGVLLLTGSAMLAQAQRVALDPAFGTAGSVLTGLTVSNFGFQLTGTAGPQWSGMGQTLVDADGNILVCGNEGTQFQLRRYLPNGNPDSSFGTNGLVTTAFPRAARPGGMAVQADGKIVVVGGMAGSIGYAWAAARYLPTGALDASFGSNGLAYPADPSSASPSELARVVVLPNGKLFAVGSYSREASTRLLLFLPTGQPDVSFGIGGMTSAGGLFEDLAVQPDNKVLLITTYNGTSGNDVRVLRYLPTGQLDSTFGTNGQATVSALPYPSGGTMPPPTYLHGLAVQPDGKILLAGHCTPSISGRTDQPVLLRLNADGTPDTAFNSAAHRSLDVGLGSGLAALALHSDGRIVVGGTARPWPSQTPHLLLARYLPTGALDPTFNSTATTPGTYVALVSNTPLVRTLKVLPTGQLLATEPSAPTTSTGYTLRLTRYTAGPLATRRATTALQLQAAPVPAATELRLRYMLPTTAPVRLLLRDALGRTVRATDSAPALAGVREAALSVAMLPAGTYSLTLEAGTLHQTVRVAVAP